VARTRLVPLVATLLVALTLTGCVRDESDPVADAGASPTPPTTAPPTTPPTTTPPTTPPTSVPPDTTPPPVDPNPPPSTPPMTDVARFQATLYPLLRDPANFCVGCHGAAQIPTFAVDDAMTAYNVITTQQKVNLANPELSRIYLRPSVDRHNCGANASCDRVAADFLVAIQAWANQQPAPTPPSPSGPQILKSSTTSLSSAGGATARADANVVALFKFDEGAGTTTVDTSGVGTPMTLEITNMEWADGGLKNVTGKAQANATDSRKLFDMIGPAGQFSVEAWIAPANITQDGPARIVTYSSGTGTRNFMMGQAVADYRFRNKSAAANVNGDPALDAAAPDVAAALQHVVMTFDPAVGRKLYVNGQVSATETAPTTLAWTNDQTFVIGNETTNDRPWQGTFQLVAIHKKALSAAEVQQNFNAGTGSLVTLNFDVSSILGAPGRVELLAGQVDAASYVFAKPKLVTDVAGVKVKNIRIAVNDAVPVAAQSFRRVDAMVNQSGTELSRLGAVVPVALGADKDQFHLEFEALGTKVGLAEAVAPSAPPAPAADLPEPALGVRSFSKMNDTMSALTGVSRGTAAINTLYTELRDSLPATDDVLAFGSAQQVAIQRLATAYCGAVVTNTTACTDFFGACTIAAGTRTTIADRIYDRLLGVNIANQPDKAAVNAELVDEMNDLGCTAGCTGATATTALQATCSAALSSAAVTIN
jgi:hypothetical protein